MTLDPRFANLPFPVTLTTDIYWAAQPDPVKTLRGADASSAATSTLAYQLAQQGFIIDKETMVWQWDPVLMMVLRTTAGYTWVPSLLQPAIQEAPGVTGVTGALAYDPAHPPSGSIKVSVDAADYPPADPPPPPPPALPSNMVGPKAMSSVSLPNPDGTSSVVDMYIAGPGTKFTPSPNVANGQQITQGGVVFTARYEFAGFGMSVVYTCKPGSVQS